MRILLVDDDAFLRDMYAKKFSAAGHDIDTAESPASALRKIAGVEKYDAVLLDMVMPGMTGSELVKEIKSSGESSAPVCIVLSNMGQPEDVASAKKAGADGYLIKADTVPSNVVTEVESIVSEK